jgi:tetratricopeptide (TPR) repeat protein
MRRRPPRPRPQQQALNLWLVFGGIAAAVVIATAVQTNVERARAPVEGAAPAQQERVDELRATLERDSTNVEARVALGDLLYDTGNWEQAIEQYQRAVALDSTQVPAIVDLGVCYYNLGQGAEAEQLFHLALSKDPSQSVALFNLGILYERRKEYDQSLKYFHGALASNPPDDMKPVIVDALQRLQQLTGRTPPPLPGNSP